jgi:mono/diheme cytochrome c family protein
MPTIRASVRPAAALVVAGAIAVTAALIAQEQPAAPTPAPAPTPGPLVVPAAAKTIPNPVPASAESLELGRTLFASQCALCHGKTGDGRGDFAPQLGAKVPDLTDPARMNARTDGELYYILAEGHGKMPGNEARLHEESRWHLVNALRAMVRGS